MEKNLEKQIEEKKAELARLEHKLAIEKKEQEIFNDFGTAIVKGLFAGLFFGEEETEHANA